MSTAAKRSLNKKALLLTILWVVIILLVGALFYVLTLNRTLSNAEAKVTGIDDPAAIVNRISDIFIVPTDETPTVARIENAEKIRLTNPQFYAKAETGDILVVFTDIAFIYRDSVDKIVNVAPVFINDGSTTKETENNFVEVGADDMTSSDIMEDTTEGDNESINPWQIKNK